MTTYSKQMQRIVNEYRLSGNTWPAQSKDIAHWAILNGKWEVHQTAAVKLCSEEISRAMREEYITDSHGHRVRVKHPASKIIQGKQMMFWDDIRTAPRSHMHQAFQQRRMQIVGDCRQLKTDVTYYNEGHLDEEPIQLILDFEMDLAELDAAS